MPSTEADYIAEDMGKNAPLAQGKTIIHYNFSSILSTKSRGSKQNGKLFLFAGVIFCPKDTSF